MSEPVQLDPVTVPPAKAQAVGRRAWYLLWRVGAIVLIAWLVWSAGREGLRYRAWAWDYTRPIHYFPDVNNGYYWGTVANGTKDRPRGVANMYDHVARLAGRDNDPKKDYQLDYAPLRLTLITRWVAWARATYPETAAKDPERLALKRAARPWEQVKDRWNTTPEFYAPLLNFNTAMEIAAALGLFLLAHHWARRGEAARAPKPSWWELRARLANTWPFTPRPFRGWIAGLVAAAIWWFSPAVVVSGHGWPTWDLWVVPFFVWAVYLACVNWWFAAGVVIAAGAMFKGQQLFVAPIFVLWPLFAGRPIAGLRWIAGLLFGVGVIAVPWMLTYVPGGVTASSVFADRVIDYPAITWICGATLAPLIAAFALRHWRPWGRPMHRVHAPGELSDPSFRAVPGEESQANENRPAEEIPRRVRVGMTVLRKPWFVWTAWLFCVLVLLAMMLWPLAVAEARGYAKWIVTFAVATLLLAYLLPRKSIYLAGAVLGSTILLTAHLFHGSLNWLHIGWGYGTRHYQHMTMGVSDNLAGLLSRRFGWEEVTDIAYIFDANPTKIWLTNITLFTEPTKISIWAILVTLYVITFLLSAIGAAMQFRRNDPRFLVAISAPWMCFFAFMPQIHERYLLFAAGIACSLTAVSVGMTLIAIFLHLLTCVMTLHVMLIHGNLRVRKVGGVWQGFGTDVSETFGRSLKTNIDATFPDAGWAVLVCAGVFLYLSLALRRRKHIELPLKPL